MALRVNCYFCLFVLFLHNVNLTTSYCHKDDTLYLIRSKASNLVWDSIDNKVVLQHFDGYTPQLWQFKWGRRPGLFIIKNNGTGTVLDVDKTERRDLILAPESTNSLNQEWYLHANGHIFNAGFNFNVHVDGGKYVPGNPMRLWPKEDENPSQDFIIKEKRTCGP